MKEEVGNIKFEEALEKLEHIVRRIESGQLTLEETMEEFTKGIELYNYCLKVLNEAEGKIKMIVEKEDGEYNEIDFTT
ncbi:Exodeoxyribonuclease VII small subunit [Caloranaerobacter azorensis DSM 13643]|uniref:Exodeoxyribonuclease 7 small subunit n=1 Tax=Caloranaerobacter azorensis DSM 13643 TaxID=1121264 RepID=A0A1M5VN30_9FIRM|nr:exodeoxyribonuclease VII small subunit [Caloranaerobacter azorensis]SHH76662.1 Exodeoxyribonuclease VII small subunit [Caloranaerobacter azorensis DSM 13643]